MRQSPKILPTHLERLAYVYIRQSFQAMLAENGLVGSMGRPGCPYDNAPVEGFFSIAKRECLYRKKYDNIDEVEKDLFASLSCSTTGDGCVKDWDI